MSSPLKERQYSSQRQFNKMLTAQLGMSQQNSVISSFQQHHGGQFLSKRESQVPLEEMEFNIKQIQFTSSAQLAQGPTATA
jgi:hypothetical protein